MSTILQDFSHPDVTRGEMLLLHHGEIEQLVLLSGMLINKKLVLSHFEVCQDNWHEYVYDVRFYRYNSIHNCNERNVYYCVYFVHKVETWIKTIFSKTLL